MATSTVPTMSSPSPPGFMPGSDQPDYNRGPEILGAVVSVTFLALVSVCTRIYVRACMVNRVGVDVSDCAASRPAVGG